MTGFEERMRRVLCSQLPAPDRPVDLPQAEAHHLIQVLRARNGETVEALDGRGRAVVAKLELRGKSARLFYVEDVILRTQLWPQVLPLRLEIAALKGPAMEWTVEKAVELGVHTLAPVLTAHTVVQIGRKDPRSFQERWQKIADQALKQCGRLEAMKVELPRNLDDLLASTDPVLRFWCHEGERENSPFVLQGLAAQDLLKNGAAVLVGPEGGWSEAEIRLLQASAKPVSLGPLVLRAETAAVFAVSALAAQLRMEQRRGT